MGSTTGRTALKILHAILTPLGSILLVAVAQWLDLLKSSAPPEGVPLPLWALIIFAVARGVGALIEKFGPKPVEPVPVEPVGSKRNDGF